MSCHPLSVSEVPALYQQAGAIDKTSHYHRHRMLEPTTTAFVLFMPMADQGTVAGRPRASGLTIRESLNNQKKS